jgi:hypothetical protein
VSEAGRWFLENVEVTHDGLLAIPLDCPGFVERMSSPTYYPRIMKIMRLSR